MKRSLIAVGGVFFLLGGAFLVYSVPYGKRIGVFESNFNSSMKNIGTDSENLRGIRGLEAFCQAIDDIPTQVGNIISLRAEHVEIQNASNFIRNLWKTMKISSNDLQHMNGNIDALYPLIEPGIIVVINRMQDETRRSFTEAVNLSSVEQVCNRFNSDVIKISYSLMAIEKNISNTSYTASFPSSRTVDFAAVTKMKRGLQSALSPGLEAMVLITRTTSKEQLNRVELSGSVKGAVDILKAHVNWLDTAKIQIGTLAQLGAITTEIAWAYREIDKIIEGAKSDISLVTKIIMAQMKSNEEMKSALQLAESANNSLQNIERFSSSNQILSVHRQWDSACDAAERSRASLYVASKTAHEKAIVDSLLNKSRGQVNSIVNELISHRDFVHEQYEEARNQESSMMGSATRSVQRGLERLRSFVGSAAQRAAESRIGKEIMLSAKTLILGTKAFYELLDPNTDPVSWAFSYESDVDQLLNEANEINNMKGPSLTGKNTVIEDLVNRSYSAAFKKGKK
ncbi:MAG: hypothetical protein OEW18_00970 [Candidatus Aminicenantes bacterium]|nr:hypothetical protein [Candidatus Aminicenantes bacterium]